MSHFDPINKLDVYRHFSDNHQVKVGTLAQNPQSVYFQYDSDYLTQYPSLSPFKLPFNAMLHRAPANPHQGLFGVFADSLPDGWGLYLMDRVFQQHGILPQQLTPMDRLAYIGQGMGALAYAPQSDYRLVASSDQVDIAELGKQAQALFEGQTEEVLAQLANAGGSGGARPKAQIYINTNHPELIRSLPAPGYVPWLVKFTSRSLPLGQQEGLCEAAYLTLATNAGIDVPVWQLIIPPKSSASVAWLAMQRFDCLPNGGRYHVHSVCGLLDADFRVPSLDYEQLIKAGQVLCKSPAVGQALFVRAVFNLFALNQDDHSRNWAFMQADDGQWKPSPFYDVTFSPSPYGEHMTAYMGHGKNPPLKVMQQLAQVANFADWKHAQQAIQQVVHSIHYWSSVATELGVKKTTKQLIQKRLDEVYRQNKGLLS